MSRALVIENLSKEYRLGLLGHGAFYRDFQSWWARMRGREDPNAKMVFFGDADKQLSSANIWALRDVSLEVEQGDVLGLIGLNGAGKSTLLKILARVTIPTVGLVKIRGRVASLLEVGTGFHPELTGRENVFLNGAILGMRISEIHQKFDQIIDFAGVERFIDTPVKRYSSGMYVRLAFAVAAHLDAEILLVDEVLAVGDIEFQKKCLAKIGEVTSQGRTVVFVSHNMGAITALCKRGVLLEQGRLTQEGTAAAVVASYISSIASFAKVDNGYLSLAGHPGRQKTCFDGVVQLTHCILSDDTSRGKQHFTNGKPMHVTIGYQENHPVRKQNLAFTVMVENIKGQTVAHLSSEVAGMQFDNLASTGEVRCTLPRLGLVPGTYTLSLACRVAGEWSDWISQVVSFDVIGAEFYPTKLLPPQDMAGDVLMDYEWEALP